MSKRAELRRTQREEKRANTATYNLTQAQLDAIVNEKIGKKIAETKQEIYEETVNTVMALVLTLPLEVLMDHYWQKSYRQRLPGLWIRFWRTTKNGRTEKLIWKTSRKIYGSLVEYGLRELLLRRAI